jgi:hypothetical protein
MVNHKYILAVVVAATAAVLMATTLEFGYQAKALQYESSTSCINDKCISETSNSTSSFNSDQPTGYVTSCLNGKCHTQVFKSGDMSIP